ncbi:MAG: helix-turn-helix transcriptional regulator [Myxococcales bacterium]|jgi:transcriptional regulator with XRE-family HTH domain|nr:helix-turn-helix transcriptional regulator [Myxococcales bacterium]
MPSPDQARKIELPSPVPTPVQVRQARASLQIGQRELARCAGISVSTLNAYEQGKRPAFDSTVARLRQTLEELGMIFGEDGHTVSRK